MSVTQDIQKSRFTVQRIFENLSKIKDAKGFSTGALISALEKITEAQNRHPAGQHLFCAVAAESKTARFTAGTDTTGQSCQAEQNT